jgi:hypothetical protein
MQAKATIRYIRDVTVTVGIAHRRVRSARITAMTDKNKIDNIPAKVKNAEKIFRNSVSLASLYSEISGYKNTGIAEHAEIAKIKALKYGAVNQAVMNLIDDFVNVHRFDNYKPHRTNRYLKVPVDCKFIKHQKHGQSGQL